MRQGVHKTQNTKNECVFVTSCLRKTSQNDTETLQKKTPASTPPSKDPIAIIGNECTKVMVPPHLDFGHRVVS